MQGRLVLLDQQQVVAPNVVDLLAERALAEQGVAGEYAPMPVHAINQVGRHGELGLGLVGVHGDRFMHEDDPLLVAERAQSMHRSLIGKPQSPPLSLAVDRHALGNSIGRGHRAG